MADTVHLIRDCVREDDNGGRAKVARVVSTVFDAEDPAIVRAM